MVLERTVPELHRQQCISFNDQSAPKKEIAYTRSFGQPMRTLHELTQAVTEVASGAVEKIAKAKRAGWADQRIYTYKPL